MFWSSRKNCVCVCVCVCVLCVCVCVCVTDSQRQRQRDKDRQSNPGKHSAQIRRDLEELRFCMEQSEEKNA